MSAERQRRLAVAMIAGLLGGICVYAIRQVDADLYGYLAYGRLFAERGGTSVDPFAYTSQGTPWVAFEHLAQLLLWLAYADGGAAALIALKCAVGGAAVAAMWFAVREFGDDPFVTLPVFLVCASTVSRYFLFRPQLFTFACFAIYVAILFRFLVRGRAPLWLLPAMMLLWVNLHGGFLAGLGAIGLAIVMRAAAAGWRAVRPLAVVLAAAFAATFITPWGAGLWRYVLHELSHDTNRRYIDEWRPAGLTNDPWSAVVLTFLAATILVFTALASRRPHRIAGLYAWQWAASAAPLVVMSYVSVRHAPLAAIWCAPVIALLAAEVRRQRVEGAASAPPRRNEMEGAASAPPRRSGTEGGASAPPGRPPRVTPMWLAFSVVACLPIVFTLQFVIANPRPAIAAGGRFLGPRNPCRAVTFMRDSGVAGNVFTPLWWGSYLTWYLYPDVRVSMDGRNISAFPAALVAENLRFYSHAAGTDLAGVPLQYDTDYLLVPSDVPILQTIAADPRWTRVYADDDAWVFARSAPGGATMPREAGSPSAPGSPTAAGSPCDPVFR